MPIMYIFDDFSKYLGTLFVYDAYVREIPPIYCTAWAARPAKSARPAKFQNSLIRDFSRISNEMKSYVHRLHTLNEYSYVGFLFAAHTYETCMEIIKKYVGMYTSEINALFRKLAFTKVA